MHLQATLRRTHLLIAVALVVAPVGAAADVLPPQIHVVAGGGACSGAVTSGGACNNVAATSVSIAGAQSVAALPGGAYLYIDSGNDLVREVSATGKVTTVAGTTSLVSGTAVPDLTDVDGVPATDSGLDDPVAVSALPNGGFLITEYGGNRVREVSPGGPGTATITTIDGVPPVDVPPPHTVGGSNPGTAGSAADELDYPTDAVPTAAGGVLIADEYNHRVMNINSWSDPTAITQIAGGGGCNVAETSCDGMEASQIDLDLPLSVSELPNGTGYLIADEGADTVDQVSSESPTGTLSVVAGEPGRAGYAGDGGPATSAQLDAPEQALALSTGGFMVADTGNNVVREVSPNGVISTIAGNGTLGDSGDGGSATAAQLNGPSAVAPTINGGILIADDYNSVIREITLAPTSYVYLNPSAPNGANGWYTVDPVVAVGTTEGASVSCVLDPGQAPPVYAAIIPGCTYATAVQAVTQNGTHTLWVASDTSLGADEYPTSVTFKIDTTPPTVTCAKEPVFAFGKRSATVSGTLTDSIAGPATLAVTAAAATDKAGTFEASLTGTNNAGLSTTVKCPYRVRGRPARAHPSKKHKRER